MWKDIPVVRYHTKEELLRKSLLPQDRVLDVGFWGQAHTSARVTWPHHTIRSITPHLWGVDLIYDESELEDPSRYKKAPAENFSFDERFNAIVALDLIEHLTNPGLFLACAERHLAPDGRLILSTPNAFNLFVLAGKLTRPEPPINADHTFYFNRPTIATLLAKCGWEIESFGVIYTLGDLHEESLKKKVLNGVYKLCSQMTDKYYETMVVIAKPIRTTPSL